MGFPMSLTEHCDVFGALHERGINRIIEHVMRQRPSLFNYGTALFVARPELLCHRITPHPEVVRRHNPLITVEDPLPIPGTDGQFGMDFCAQITRINVDFHPSNIISLPSELGPLPAQRAAFSAEFCVGLVCPDKRIVERLGDALAATSDKQDIRGEKPDNTPRPPVRPLPGEKVECFCLSVFAVLHIDHIQSNGTSFLVLRLDGIEIVDITPVGLENALECYVATILRLGLLPKMRFALDTMIFELGDFLTVSVGLTPISSAVPNNPAIEQDQLKVFTELGFGP